VLVVFPSLLLRGAMTDSGTFNNPRVARPLSRVAVAVVTAEVNVTLPLAPSRAHSPTPDQQAGHASVSPSVIIQSLLAPSPCSTASRSAPGVATTRPSAKRAKRPPVLSAGRPQKGSSLVFGNRLPRGVQNQGREAGRAIPLRQNHAYNQAVRRHQRLLVSLAFYVVLVGGFVAAGFHHHAAPKTHRQISPPLAVPVAGGPVQIVDTACISSGGDRDCTEFFRQACANGIKEACIIASGSTDTLGASESEVRPIGVSFSPSFVRPLYYSAP
jgi:hypothetical protein